MHSPLKGRISLWCTYCVWKGGCHIVFPRCIWENNSTEDAWETETSRHTEGERVAFLLHWVMGHSMTESLVSQLGYIQGPLRGGVGHGDEGHGDLFPAGVRLERPAAGEEGSGEPVLREKKNKAKKLPRTQRSGLVLAEQEQVVQRIKNHRRSLWWWDYSPSEKIMTIIRTSNGDGRQADGQGEERLE